MHRALYYKPAEQIRAAFGSVTTYFPGIDCTCRNRLNRGRAGPVPLLFRFRAAHATHINIRNYY